MFVAHRISQLSHWVDQRPTVGQRRLWRWTTLMPLMVLYLGGTAVVTLVLLTHAQWSLRQGP